MTPESATRSEILLEAKGVTFTYSKSAPVLHKWSAQFSAGEVTALTGPSGRGKSTLLYLLGLMLQPSEGEVVVAGRRTSTLTDLAKARLRAHRFGFVFQDAALDGTRTVLDNVTETALYRRENRREAEVRARHLLDEFDVRVPVNRKPGQVSGGQAQRIALARSLLSRPDVLLADEPTGNLDPATSQVVVDALRQHAREGNTVIVVTHSPEVAAAADREIRL